MRNPIQPRAWLITKENVLSVSLLLSLSPPRPFLKYLEVDGGTGLLEAVGSAPMRGASLGLIGLWVAPYSTQHEAVLHSWPVHFSYAAVKLPQKRAHTLKIYKYGKMP